MQVKIQKLSAGAVLPKKATPGAAAYDVYLPKETILFVGRQAIPLDIALSLPAGYEAKIEPRSGFSLKGMEIEGGDRVDADVLVGKIDSDYRGNIKVIVHNRSGYKHILPKGMRIAQLTIYKAENAEWEEVESLDSTERGEGGFGHTGC